MSKCIDLMKQCENELEKISNVIKVYEKELAALEIERCKVLSKMKDIDMGIVLECIERNGLSGEEVIKMILTAAKNKRRCGGAPAC